MRTTINEQMQRAIRTEAAVVRHEQEIDRLRAYNAELVRALRVALPHLLRDESQSEAAIRAACFALDSLYEKSLHYAGRLARATLAKEEEAQ